MAQKKPAAKKPESTPQDAEAARMRQLFTDPIVDMDVFSEGFTSYHVTDVKGVAHDFDVPNDPPFPNVAALLRAHDEYSRTQEQLARLVGRTSPKDRAQERKLSANTDRQWFAILKALAALLALRSDDAPSAETLRDEYGAATTGDWVGVVIMRVQVRRLGPDVEKFITELLSGAEDPKGPEADPEKDSASRSRTRSESSGASTPGPTTTGEPSDGQNFGGPSTSRDS